jgi:kinesin family protein 3/17
MWNEELGEWQLKCIAYTGNNIRKPKEKEIDKDKLRNLDFSYVYSSYTNDGAERAMRDQKRAKSGKNKKKQQQQRDYD